ncbi:MAG: 4Fe-4S binding protein, partial [Campylobacterales bacterium]|nr:4Fe-4S binding protein [Campylobacterales bacterium]
CPSDALSSDKKKSKIFFNPFFCIKCKLCEDVCETNSIFSIENFDIFELLKPANKELISFSIIRCHECNNFFTSIDGAKLCKRCQIEEEEALKLWGLA